MKPYTKILVPSDFSSHADEALEPPSIWPAVTVHRSGSCTRSNR